jgi:4-amino-4-deoxy-L-arabinose transferase-like glycosyltransferase
MKTEGNKFISSLLLFLLVTGVTITMRLVEFYAPLDRDGGVFAYIGASVLAGDLPYQDIWDHKTPAVYYLNALALTSFGHTVASLRYMEIIFAVATAWTIYLLGLKLLRNHWAAIIATLSFTLVSNSYIFSSNGGDLHFTEAFMQLPIVLGIAFVTTYKVTGEWYRFLGAGVMGGCAILFKPPGGFFLAAVALWTISLAWHERKHRHNVLLCLVNLVIGMICPLALMVAYFALRGGLADLYSQVIMYNSVYVSNNLRQNFFQSLVPHLNNWLSSLGFVWIPAGAGLIWGKGSTENQRLLTLWFIFDLGGAILGGRYYPHYFLQILPSFTLLAGYGWLALKDRQWLVPYGFRNIALISYIIATLLVFLIGQFQFTYAWISFRLNGNLTITEQAARFFAANTTKEETIYVWGAETVIYFLSERKSASRYVYLYPLLARGYSSPEQVNDLLRDIEIQKPRYILDTSVNNELIPSLESELPHRQDDALYAQDDLDPIRLFIAQQYYPQTRINDWIVYERVVTDEN